MSKHTPAPWRLSIHPEYAPMVQRGRSGGFVVSDVDRERALADARLISAAPDLLAVVQAYLGTIGNKKGKPDVADVDDMARKAVAKATAPTQE